MVDVVPLAQDLIRRRSITPQDDGALDLLQQVLEGLGFRCLRLRFSSPGTPDVDNLYARLGSAAPTLAFAGHVDVVPPGDAAAWRREPFSGALQDGLLHGRGAVDMKGAIACWIAAVARRLVRRGPPPGSLSLLITGDEEGPALNGTQRMLEALAARGERFDGCITGEPTNPQRLGQMMKIGRRGSLNGFLTIHGRQGHTGYPHLADNAAHRLVTLLAALTAWEIDRSTAHFEPSTLAISTIDIGNPATNIIPGTARAVFNIRFNDQHRSATLITAARARLDSAAGADGRYDLEVQVSGEAFLTPPGPLSALVADACAAVTGLRPELSTSGGTSDSRFIRAFCPVVDFGLVNATMHQANEAVPLADLEQLSTIYERIIDGFFTSSPRS